MEEFLEEIKNWDELPAYLKDKVSGTNQEQIWQSMAVAYHCDNHIRFKNYERMGFYRDLIRFLRLKLEVFPYHLCRFLNFTTPFDYYIEMLCDLLRVQKAYDCLPTFTAADILRIIGIHRNSYTELLQKCKEKGWISKISRAIRNMLPKYPLSVPVEGWWLVFPLLHKKPRKTANKNEVDCLSDICKDFSAKSNSLAGRYDKEALEGLYKATVLEFDIELDDLRFELIRDIKNFVPDKSGFGRILGEVLKLCESFNTVQSVKENSKFSLEIIKDSLSLLCRLGFLEVQKEAHSTWHKSWLPVSDLENSVTSSVFPSFDASGTEEAIKLTLAPGRNCNATILKNIREMLSKYQVEIMESPNPAIALSSSSAEPVVFSTLTSVEAILYRLFKLKFCGVSPVLYLSKGFVLTTIPQEIINFSYFILHLENSVQESCSQNLLQDLSEILPQSSVFVIPCRSKLVSLITLPLPLNLLNLKDKVLLTFFKDKNLFSHFENFIGWLEIASLLDKSYIVLSQNHGIDFSSQENSSNIITSLLETSWFKYNNLETASEAQQDEVFQFREFSCGIDLDNGYVLLE